MIATWPEANGGATRHRVERIAFWTVGISVFLDGGIHFPVPLAPAALADFHRRYQLGEVDVLSFSQCPLMPPVVLH